MVKGKTKETPQEIAHAAASDSKPNEPRPSSPEIEEISARSVAKIDCSSGTEAIAAPSIKKASLQQKLADVEGQIFDLETALVSSSHPAYSIFKGYNGLLPANKRKATSQVSERVFSDSSVKIS